MGVKTDIAWADATINFWIGCTEVSPACDNCYAREQARRYHWAEWGPGRRRYITKGAKTTAFALERKAIREGRRLKVFANSLSDFFDNEMPDTVRDNAVAVIDGTPHLDWMLLTKRPHVARKYLADKRVRPNIWLGTTVENQAMAEVRIPMLLDAPAAVRFVSAEPLLGALNLFDWIGPFGPDGALQAPPALDWVICGGESGEYARPMHPAWARSLRDQCAGAGVPFLFKQWGEWAPYQVVAGGDLGGEVRRGHVRIVHPSARTDVEIFEATGGRNTEPGSRYMARLGKDKAGRLLDGVLHHAFPETRAAA